MWHYILYIFGIKIVEPQKYIKVMITTPQDLYVLIEVNQEGVTSSEPMDEAAMLANIVNKYGDQPLRYFNDYKRLKVIHLKSGKVKDAALRIEFQ
jgi:hypothetical protein